MKVTKLFLTAAIALGLGLTACSNDDDISSSGGEEKGNTNVSVTLKMSQSSGLKATKALPDDYNPIGEWAGKDEIKSVTVYLVDGTTVSPNYFTVGNGYTQTINAATKEVILTPTKAIKTTAGIKKVYVLINGTSDVTAALAATPAAAFEAAYKTTALALANSGAGVFDKSSSADKLAVKNDPTNPTAEAIVMTNVAEVTINVAPNVSEAQALQNPDPLNRASVSVERAVARVMVTTAAEEYEIKSGADILGKITEIKWVVAQGESSLFIQRKAEWGTPNYGWELPDEATFWGTDITGANSKYDYSGLFEDYDATTQFGGTAVATMNDYLENDPNGKVIEELENKLSGKFILPNTHAFGVEEASKYKKGNTAYVLVRAKFTPSVFADGETYTAGEDFFVGANGKFYTTAENAQNTATGGVANQKVARYVKGKVLYYAWVNPDDLSAWYNSPVIRNNVYHIHITGFRNLGTNWNPLFPEDPDNPKGPADPSNPGKNLPLNPDPKPSVPDYEEPENPIDPTDPLTTPETWMSVDVKVLSWKLHSYAIDLGI